MVSHHFPIAKSDVLNMEAIAFLSRYPVWTGSYPIAHHNDDTSVTLRLQVLTLGFIAIEIEF